MSAALEAMKEILGGPPVLNQINVAFSQMAIAEEVIEESGCTKDQGQRAFGVMCPSEPLRGKSNTVYKAHCEELMVRVMGTLDTRTATKAEVLCCLMGAALKAPLDTSGLALADWLFAEVFPDSRLPMHQPREVVREFYKGQVQEDFQQARKRCAVADRVAS